MPMRLCSRTTGAAVCALMMLFTTTLPAHATMIGTDEVLTGARAEAGRAELMHLLDRDRVRAELRALDVDPRAARERVARMTDAEVAELRGRIESLPAGQSVGGTIVLVFLVFVLTDVLGATDIFPFVDAVD